MRLHRILFIPLIVFAIEFPVFSQTYRMESYNTQSGLLSDHVNDLAQDYDGTIWIATTKGLSKFDGIQFQNFLDSSNLFPISLSSKLKVVGPKQLVFVGLNSASHFIARYLKESKWIDLKIPDSLELNKNRVWDASVIKGELIVKYINNNVLYSYKASTKSWTAKPLPTLAINNYRKIKIEAGTPILLAQSGIYEETDIAWKAILSFTEAQQKNNPIDILFDNDADSTIWVAGTNWLGQLSNGKIERIPIKTKESNPKFQQLRKSSNGFLFLRSERSFYWYHVASKTMKAFVPISDDVGVANSRLLIDQENGLWITSYRGLHHIPSFIFSGLKKDNGLFDAEVSLIAELEKDKYLVGLQNGYEILKDDSIIYSRNVSLQAEGFTTFIQSAKTKTNEIYVSGSQLGVGHLLPDMSIDWIPFSDTAVVLVSYLKDTLWAATNTGQLYFLANKKFIKRNHFNGYPRHITVLNNSLIISTRSGVRIVSGLNVTEINQSSDLLRRQVYCSFVENGKIYLGTEGGLSMIDGDVIKKTSIHEKTIDRAIYSIIKGKDGIWFGTDNGLYLLQDTILSHFDESSGLFGWEINRGALIEDSKGRMVIGTNKGLNFYDPLYKEEKALRFEPAIKWIRTNNKIFTPLDSIYLSSAENFITIGLQAISFTRKPIEFRYRMVGYQDNWQYLSSSDVREVVYRSLPAGDFTFEFQARLASSTWSKRVISQPLHIATSFYKSYSFFFVLFLLAVAIGYLIRWLLTTQKTKAKLERDIAKSIRELRKSEAKLELALENSKLGVWIYSFESNKSEFSHEMYEILDLPPLTEPLNKASYLSIVYPPDRDGALEKLRQAIASQTPYDLELRIVQRNGTLRWLHVKGKATYKSDGIPNLLSGTMNNISVRKAQEADREMIISELEKTNKELDRFIYSVSHDLSAPIRSIQGLINLTRMESLTKDTVNYLNLIERSINRQNIFIKEIIEYGRNSRMPVQIIEMNLENLIHNILEDLSYSEHYAVTQISVNLDPQVKTILCDPIRMKIILNNLLSNALKFKSKYKEQHKVTITAFKKEKNFGLTIEDNGIGIDKKHFGKLFTMFYRATDQQPGSGIGLYIAHESAKKIGMNLSVFSTVGEGTTFTLS